MSSLGIFDKETKTYKKVAGTAEAAVVDGSMSDISTNPVQNKVIKKYVDENFDFSTSTSKLLNDTTEAPLVLNKATRNLLNPTLATSTQNGITCTNNGDGTYIFNGTATGVATFIVEVISNTVKKYANKDLRLSGCPKNGSIDTYRLQFYSEDQEAVFETGNGAKVHVGNIVRNVNISIVINTGIKVNNLTFKPMLTTDLSTTINDFVPYSGYDIKTCGKNLVDVNSFESGQVLNGVTFTADKKAGTITLNGTSTGRYYGALFSFSFIDGIKEYSFGGWDTSKITAIQDQLGLYSNSDYHFDGINNNTKIEDNKIAYINIVYRTGVTFNNFVIKPYVSANYNTYAGYGNIEPYNDWGTVHIDSTTEFPLLGLKSFNGITNIISPGNVEVTYAKSDNGAAILNGIAAGANRTTVDTALSSTSTNPVQNKVVKSALDNKSDINHTHNYAGSSSAGGSANSAVKLDTATAGSATQPVYFSGGKPVACSHTLGKSVPSDAVFTDTKVTNTLDTHTKAYVTGTTSASTNTGTQIFDTGVYLGTGTGQLFLEGSNNVNYGTNASIFNVKIPASHNNKLYGANIAPYRDDMTNYVTGLNINCGTSTGPGMRGIEVTCRVNNYSPTVYIDRSGGTNSYALQVPNGKSYIATIYSDSSTITISDREKKTDIQSISDKYEELFFKLQPRLFKFKDGTSGRIHIGAIAQEVEEALKDVGLSDTEFAGFVRQEKEHVVNEETGEITQEEGYDYYLRYEEFVMLLCHMLQKLYAEKEEQDNKISDLESRIAALESKLG